MEKVECGVCYEKPEEIKQAACCKQMICVVCYPKCKKCPFCRDTTVFNPDYKPEQDNNPSIEHNSTPIAIDGRNLTMDTTSISFTIPAGQPIDLHNSYLTFTFPNNSALSDVQLMGMPLIDFRDRMRRAEFFPERYEPVPLPRGFDEFNATSSRRKRHHHDPIRHSAPRNARGRR